VSDREGKVREWTDSAGASMKEAGIAPAASVDRSRFTRRSSPDRLGVLRGAG
jgi:hypothetical protein